MRSRTLIAPVAALGLTACAAVGGSDGATEAPAGYKQVSELVELPRFIPGLGTLYVQPETLPAGPFLAYDRQRRHVSTIYMIPLDEMNAKSQWRGLAAPGGAVRKVDLHYNPGHPGVNEPHYHVVLWHVAKAEADLEK